MAIGVDVINRKPRRTKGTPSYYIRNRFALAIIGVGTLCGLTFHFVPITYNLRKFLEDNLLTESKSEVERRMLMTSLLPKRTAEAIRRIEKEESSPALPYK